MAQIELPGYRSLIANRVYAEVESEGDLVGLLSIKKHRQPTKKEIIKFVVNKAKEVIRDCNETEQIDEIAALIKMLPEQGINEIADERKKALKVLEHSYKDSLLQEGRFYVNCLGGSLSCPLLNIIRATGSNEVSKYEELLIEHGKNKSNVSLSLLPDGSLPKREQVEYLLSCSVKDSNVLIVRIGQRQGYQKAADNLRMLYGSLSSGNALSKLYDCSDEALEHGTILVLRDTLENIARIRMNDLAGILLDSSSYKPETQRESERGFGSEPSLN